MMSRTAEISAAARGRIVFRLFVTALVGVAALSATTLLFALMARAIGLVG